MLSPRSLFTSFHVVFKTFMDSFVLLLVKSSKSDKTFLGNHDHDNPRTNLKWGEKENKTERKQ